jgi:hypothetical protein
MIKSCSTCRNFSPGKSQFLTEEEKMRFGKCEKFTRQDFLGGELRYFASTTRASQELCGKVAKGWEARP